MNGYLKTPTLNRVAAGDITYNKMWVTKGAFAVVDVECDGLAATSEYPLFEARQGLALPEFLRLAFTVDGFVRAATNAARGSTSRKRLNPSDFLRLPLLLPPASEQRKIASILSSVDEAIESTQVVINQLQVVKKAMMAELLTCGLPGRHTQFQATELGEVPGCWKVRPLEQWLIRVIDYRGQAPPKHHEGTCLITAKNVRSGYIDPEPREYIASARGTRYQTA